MHKLPNLLKSRHGVYYLRTFKEGKERRFSLRTKDWSIAKLHAHQYNLARAMHIRTLDVVFPSGLQFNNIHTDDDLDRLAKIVDTPAISAFLKQSAEGLARVRAAQAAQTPPSISDAATALPFPVDVPKARTKPFSDAIKLYLAQKKLENAAKTIEREASDLRRI